MVPLSVTQAEQIAAVRTWAATRAVAATAAEDRTGYETTEPDSPQVPALPSTPAEIRTNDPLARGGRRVDF